MKTNKLYVGNLPYSISEEGLSDLFAKCGTVSSVKIITDKMTSRSKGFGFVEMSTADEAQKAIDEIDSNEIDGRSIRVSFAKEQERRPGGGGGGGHRGGGGRGNFNRNGGGNRY